MNNFTLLSKLDFETKLKIEFPNLYLLLYNNTSCLIYGIECLSGWYNIIFDLSLELYNFCEENSIETPIVEQCKEKFGYLRFRCSNVKNDKIYDIISKYEEISKYTCELCGSKSSKIIKNKNGFLVNNCKKCIGKKK